ncbi:MAG: hypothetical protein QE487_07935 [Fluviicola sp.]|nr:hypothetical protein [Fluviicola sp.]
MKRLILFILVLFCFAGNAQVLSNQTINLTAGGEIYDMTYISSLNQYMVVGSFTQINGSTRNKVAFIDENGTLSPTILPWTITGVIFCCEASGSNIYLGGDFSAIGATAKHGLARITFTGVASPIFSLNAWSPLAVGNTIHDMTINGSTIVAAGDFASILNTAGTSYVRNNLVGFTLGGNISPYFTSGAIVHSGDNLNRLHVEKVTQGFLVSGPQLNWNGMGNVGALLFDLSGAFLQYVNYTDGFQNTVSRDACYVSDSLIAIERFYSGVAISTYSFNPQNGSTTSFLASGNTCYNFSFPTGNGIESYQGDLLFFDDNATSSSGTLSRGKYSFTNGYTQTNCQPIVMSGGAFNPNLTQHLKIVRNKMMVSIPTMTSINGQARNKAAFYCLEPENAKPFTVFDTTICNGNERTYTIPTSLYAEGYRWSYSGTGITYTTATQLIPQPFNGSVKLHSTAGNSITIQYGASTTAGILKIEPYMVCNAGDTLFSTAQTLSIHTVALPNLSLSADTLAFTCIVDTLNLVAQSSTAGVSYQWAYPNLVTPVSTNDTLTIFGTGSPSVIYPTGTYYAMVTEPVNGCKSNDSIFIWENTIPPSISQDSLTISAPELTCTVTQLDLFASVAGSTIHWSVSADDTTPELSNPYTIYSANPSIYYAHAVSNTNGCKAMQDYPVQFNYDQVGGIITNYPSALVIDTINCINTAITLSCGVDPLDPNAGNGTVFWLVNNTTDLNLTTADSAGMDNNNVKVYQFKTVNSLNGCEQLFEATVQFDLDVPFVAPFTGPSSLNCSVDTMTIIHPLTGGAVSESWLDGSGNPTGSNSFFVNATGDYVYEVTYNQNGCVATDTVSIIQTSELFLTSNDTLVCPGLPFVVGTTIVNNSEPPTYLWSNGATTSTITGTGGTDTELSVIVTTQSGCIGYDTVLISVTAPIAITTAGFMSCGAASGSLQVTNATGGAGGYQYSIDGVTYNSTTLFDSLSAGTFSIYVKDALGCIYSFEDTLDPMASAPTMDFLVTTYSGFNDTLAIVNTTVFAGFDSTNWVFPAGTIVFYNSDSLALIQLPDTGWYEITLVGFDDTCQYAFAKTIYSGEVSPEYNTDYNSLKIQSLVVFPNPTNGAFTLELVFGVAQNYTAMVTDNLSIPLAGMQQSGYGTTVSLPFQFPVGTSSGSYHLQVISDYDVRHITLILN